MQDTVGKRVIVRAVASLVLLLLGWGLPVPHIASAEGGSKGVVLATDEGDDFDSGFEREVAFDETEPTPESPDKDGRFGDAFNGEAVLTGQSIVDEGKWGYNRWWVVSLYDDSSEPPYVLIVEPGSGAYSYDGGVPWGAWADDLVEVYFIPDEGGRKVVPPVRDSLACLFEGCGQLEFVDASGLDTSSVTSMRRMFNGCSSLQALDATGWITSSVTDMCRMFSGCSSLSSFDPSGWDVSSVWDMRYLFQDCKSLTSLDLSGWDTSSVTEMGGQQSSGAVADGVFSGCQSLTNLNLSGWDVSSVTDMTGMFSGCWNLSSLGLSGWDVSSVRCMASMFSYCQLPSAAISSISSWDTSSATEMFKMFYYCYFPDHCTVDLSSWDTSSVRGMEAMFCGSSLYGLNISGWDVTSVNALGYMFCACSVLSTLDLSDWNTVSLQRTTRMFDGCSSLASLDLSSWDTSSVTEADGMFDGCFSLAEVRVGLGYTMPAFPEPTAEGGWWSDVEGSWYDLEGVLSRAGRADAYRSAPCELDPLASAVANGGTVYDGGDHRAEILEYMHVKCRSGHGERVPVWGNVLTEGEHYEVSYKNSGSGEDGDVTSAGTVTVTVTGVNGHAGTLTGYFEVAPQALSSARIEVLGGPFEAIGSPVTPHVRILSAQGAELVEGVDYTLSYERNVAAGTAVVTATGMGNYAGCARALFRIGGGAVGDDWADLGEGAKGYARGGALVTGWMDLGSSKYYFQPDGAMSVGWTDVEVDGRQMHYYFNPASGNLVRNTWFKIDGKTYYFRPSGNMATGFADIDDNGVTKKYYLDEAGQLLTGWQDIEVGGKLMHYYFRPSGSMATGWATIDGKNYWFRPSGNMATGFADVDDAYKRYFDGEGHMLVGWQDIGTNRYYFRASGAMQTGVAVIDGEVHTFSDKGVLIS